MTCKRYKKFGWHCDREAGHAGAHTIQPKWWNLTERAIQWRYYR